MAKAEDKLLQQALELAARPDENWVELSELLTELVDRDSSYRVQFLQRAGIDKRAVYYFLRFGRQFRSLNLLQNRRTKDRLKRVTWTRFSVISRHLTRANADRLLRLAEEKTVAELNAELRGAAYKEKPRSMNLKFSPEDYLKVERALLMCGALRDKRNRRGLGNKEEALLKLIDKAFGEQKGEASATAPRRSR
jgi:hypothetical protein